MIRRKKLWVRASQKYRIGSFPYFTYARINFLCFCACIKLNSQHIIWIHYAQNGIIFNSTFNHVRSQILSAQMHQVNDLTRENNRTKTLGKKIKIMLWMRVVQKQQSRNLKNSMFEVWLLYYHRRIFIFLHTI